jgi:hypothetical protein
MVEPGTLDGEHFNVGAGPDEPFGRVEHVGDVPNARTDRGDAEASALPVVLVVDLGHRDREAVAEALNDRSNAGSFGFEGTSLGDVQVDGQCCRVQVQAATPRIR